MTPRELIRITSDSFRSAGVPDPEYDSAALLSHLTGIPPLKLRVDTESELPQDILSRYHAYCIRRLHREPLQYILGETSFCGFLFHVDPRVLIPRPETELLCEWAQDTVSGLPAPKILDLCCGSGCLGIALKLLMPSSSVTAVDISADALNVAKHNAVLLGADIIFTQSDLFTGLANESFDLIVCNPPYIPSSACGMLQPEVLREPLVALDGGDDGLAFYRRICRDAPLHLKFGGCLRMELGDREAVPVSSIMQESGFVSIEIRNDYQSLPRMIGGMIS